LSCAFVEDTNRDGLRSYADGHMKRRGARFRDDNGHNAA
jgi:hypothetical protein